MIYYIVKTLLSALIIVAVSEIAKRSSVWAGLIASLPLTFLIAIIWLYIDTKDAARITQLSKDIFWLVLPSLVFFLALAALLQRGVHFWLSLGVSATATVIAYGLTLRLLGAFQ